MKKLFMLMLVTVFMFSLTLTAHAATKTVKTSADVNLRKGPGTNYAVVTSVSKGTTLTYAGTTTADSRGVNWFKVTYKGKTSWVSSRYAAFTTATKSVKTTGQVYLRKGPGLNYGTNVAVPSGTTLTYLNKSQKDDRGVTWYNVSYKGASLWVSGKYAKLI
ncbi:MAG: SH3 domain-containing protein [Eubacterium sp.]|nr:SH3 domain-containing protein [Eubacterium sp.]